ncbi:MAG TPA: hypothetical protein VK821_12155 [Dehalococcoidia bacterium]|nr:hypothetical protein [Dehalococcoidia bacterium]
MSTLITPVSDAQSVRRVGIWIVALTFASLTMASVAALLVWNAFPQVFPPRAHLLLAAAPLGLAAISSLIFQAAKRQRPLEIIKAVVLAAAFLFWAANQLLPDIRQALLLNDLAITLFVLDIFLAIVGWPPSLDREAITEARSAPELHARRGSTNGTSDAHHSAGGYTEITPPNPPG